MYVVMVYDVAVERVAKVLQVGRRYLTWVQNSVLEGELSPSQLARLKADLAKVVEPSDAVRFYVHEGLKPRLGNRASDLGAEVLTVPRGFETL